MMVKSKDCIKDKVTGCYMERDSKTLPNVKTRTKKDKKKQIDETTKSDKTNKTISPNSNVTLKYNDLKR